ncbi:uncharacterized protein LOC127443485 [Myxocyprinus asiaticus]|uniref:uncharacterized protein LOC127443485 n=1 Tax=Myxocyprinus asiaticus TaxID=70543 RepID=UPI00222142C4|nr:uncharacterized protein LOC127443485 [Myxocyprinus asiaticus]
MMSASTDVESKTSDARSRTRCLDTFLIVSVIALFVLFFVMLTATLFFTKHLKSEINALTSQESDGYTDKLMAGASGAAYNMQNFAYLRATNSQLVEGEVEWESIPYGKGQSIGSMYSYEKKDRVLSVKEAGSYFLYVHLTFSCIYKCPSGQFTASFYDQHENKQLTCTVLLPNMPDTNGSAPVNRTCWRVIMFLEKESSLLAKTSFSEQNLDHWKLDLNDSGFGMFMVDRLGTA